MACIFQRVNLSARRMSLCSSSGISNNIRALPLVTVPFPCFMLLSYIDTS
jgi:hypothetical protein